MIITLPNADFSGVGLGKITRLISGMPVKNLEGLYLFDDEGELGSSVSSVTDRSGNNRTAVLKSGWTAPVKRSYGVEVGTVHGSVFNVPIAANGRPQTIIQAWKPRIPGSESGVYLSTIGSTVNNLPSTPASSHPWSPWPPLQYLGIGTLPYYQIIDASNDVIGQANLRTSGAVPRGLASVVSMTVDGEADYVRIAERGRTKIDLTFTTISDYYDGVSNRGTLQLGCWNYATNRPAAAPIADLYGFAVYSSAMTDTEVATHMNLMAAIIADRGVVI